MGIQEEQRFELPQVPFLQSYLPKNGVGAFKSQRQAENMLGGEMSFFMAQVGGADRRHMHAMHTHSTRVHTQTRTRTHIHTHTDKHTRTYSHVHTRTRMHTHSLCFLCIS
jgi:hypothetical protein